VTGLSVLVFGSLLRAVNAARTISDSSGDVKSLSVMPVPDVPWEVILQNG
jgi:hypothetical protein